MLYHKPSSFDVVVDSAARLQAEDRADWLPRPHGQPAGHQDAGKSPASPPRSSCSPTSSPRPKARCWPRWPTAASWATSSWTVRCRSTWRSTRRWPNTRRYGVRPSRAIRTACSSQSGVGQRLLQVGVAPAAANPAAMVMRHRLFPACLTARRQPSKTKLT